jgi:hypothetical protein
VADAGKKQSMKESKL